MREILSIHIGQAGIQLGSTCWELFCLEHSIQPNGQISPDKQEIGTEYLNIFYSETEQGKYVPRAAFVDLDNIIIDEIATGSFRKLFNPTQFISGVEDASNNIARGYHSIGKNMIEPTLEIIRKQAENCEDLQGFLIYHSLGGGTGSGLGSLILERLSQEYSQKTKINFSIYPSGQNSVAIVEPYNATISMHALGKDSDAVVIFDNEAVYDTCKKQLNIIRPNYTVLNRLMAKTISSITTSMRFHGNLNSNLSEFRNNLVPSPNFHYLFPSYAPIIAKENFDEEIPVAEITSSVFKAENAMAKCNPENGKYLAYNLIYRGDALLEDVSLSVANLWQLKTVEFADWWQAEPNWDINNRRIGKLPDEELGENSKTACVINNNTAVTEVFERIEEKFYLMYCKRAYVHWYVSEGMEEYEFDQAFEDMKTIETEYNNLCNQSENNKNNPEEIQ